MLPSPLLIEQLEALRETTTAGPVLDLACGGGRNGLYLVQRGISTVFADIRGDALRQIASTLHREPWSAHRALAELWQVDLERPGENPLAGKSFGSIIVFHYLHRPLLPAIREAVSPGGLVVYETFTSEQARFGRPRNPDYLLEPGELEAHFAGWEWLEQFEGVVRAGHRQRAIARLVARRPS